MSRGDLSAQGAASKQNAVKRRRASKPKVKTGCIVCKIRHVKCDETKPACLKCTNTGRKCDGYETQVGQLASARRQQKALQVVMPTKMAGKATKLPLPRAIDGQVASTIDPIQYSFDFFRKDTILALDRRVGPIFSYVGRSIIENADKVPTVRLAAAAVGSINKRNQLIQSFSSKNTLPYIIDQVHALTRVAQDQYAQALGAFRSHLDHATGDKAAEISVICSWLLFAFEGLRGHTLGSMVHQVQGTAIIQKHIRQIEANGAGSPPYGIAPEVIKMFSAWDRRTSLYFGIEDSLQSLLEAAQDPTEVIAQLISRPARPVHASTAIFSSLQEATVVIEQIVHWVLDLQFRINSSYSAPDEHPHDELESHRQFLLLQTGIWRDRFAAFLTNWWFSLSPEQQNYATLLDICGRGTEMRLQALLQPSEYAVYAPRSDDMMAILDLAESLLRPLNMMKATPPPTDEMPGFLNLGLQQPLYHIASKAVDPAVRERALDLLESDPWDEQGYYSSHVALIVRKSNETWDFEELARHGAPEIEHGYYHQGHLMPYSI